MSRSNTKTTKHYKLFSNLLLLIGRVSNRFIDCFNYFYQRVLKKVFKRKFVKMIKEKGLQSDIVWINATDYVKNNIR